MGYVTSSLLANEEILYEGKISIWSLLPQILLGLILLPFFGLGLIFWIAAVIRYVTTESAITNKRIMAKFGFIKRDTIELNILRAESIRIEQGLLGRIFNYASIVVSGAGNPQTPIPGVSDPLGFRRKFLEIQEEAEKASESVTAQPAGKVASAN